MRPELYLSHLFLPLWHWENCSQSLGGSLAVLQHIHHESSLQWMDHFHACFPACLFACLPLSLAGCCLHALVISLCLLQLPSAQAYITGDTGGQFFPLCSSTTEIGCDGQRPVICGAECSLPAVFLHKSLMFDLLRVMCEVNLDLWLPELIWLWRRPSLQQNILVPFKLRIWWLFFFFTELQMQGLRIMKNESSSKCLAFPFYLQFIKKILPGMLRCK